MPSNSTLFKPGASGSKLGQKRQDDGQFSNPPAFPETSGFNGPATIGPKSGILNLEKSPGAKKGRV